MAAKCVVIEDCGYCGFGVERTNDGVTCKSGDACPFKGHKVRYLIMPNGDPYSEYCTDPECKLLIDKPPG